MMGERDPQKQLWSYQVNLDKRVRSDHALRRINLNSEAATRVVLKTVDLKQRNTLTYSPLYWHNSTSPKLN